MSGMAIAGIGAVGFTPYAAPTVASSAGTSAARAADLAGVDATDPTSAATGPTATGAAAGTSFADVLAGGIDRLEGMHDTADRLAVQAATGDLASLHQYTIAATEASVATQLTVAVRNKALEAFSEIMRMPI